MTENEKTQIQELAQAYWRKYAEIWPVLNRHPCPKVEINNRFTATGGINYSEKNLIQLSGKFMVNNRQEMLIVTLPHELAHQIDFILYGWSYGQKHHRQTWKTIMIKIGLEPEIYHKMVL